MTVRSDGTGLCVGCVLFGVTVVFWNVSFDVPVRSFDAEEIEQQYAHDCKGTNKDALALVHLLPSTLASSTMYLCALRCMTFTLRGSSGF